MSHISHVSGITVRDLLKLDNFEGDISKRENVFSKVFLQIFFLSGAGECLYSRHSDETNIWLLFPI